MQQNPYFYYICMFAYADSRVIVTCGCIHIILLINCKCDPSALYRHVRNQDYLNNYVIKP